jgi:hypothetical protein
LKTLVSPSLTLAAIALTLAASPGGARAAGSDLGYDSVTKIQMAQSTSDAPAAPGTFQTDFQAASNVPKSTAHGMFGKMIANMQNMGTMFKTGTAERHYYGSTKFRTDNVGLGTGDITDCTARTLTHLDLNAKTYHVTSLDQPETPSSGSGHAAPGPAATDDGTKMAIDLTTRALGPMTIENVATNGYDMNMKITVTKADGESSSFNEDMVSYYSSMADPHTNCPEQHLSMGPGAGAGAGGASMAQMMMAMQAINGKGSDSRFKITTSGPPLPGGKLAMWQLMSMKGAGGSGGGFGMEIERGDVHQLSDGDPAFSVPADFTKV